MKPSSASNRITPAGLVKVLSCLDWSRRVASTESRRTLNSYVDDRHTLAPLVRRKFKPNWMYANVEHKPWSAAYISVQRNHRIKALWQTLNRQPFKSKAALVGGTISAIQGTAIFKINFSTEMVQVVPNWWYRNVQVVPNWWYRNVQVVVPNTTLRFVWYRNGQVPKRIILWSRNGLVPNDTYPRSQYFHVMDNQTRQPDRQTTCHVNTAICVAQ